MQDQIQVRRFIDVTESTLRDWDTATTVGNGFGQLACDLWSPPNYPRSSLESVLLQRDRLLNKVTEATTCLLTNPSLEESLPTVLELLSTAIDADRLYIYECSNHPETEGIAMGLRCDWRKPDTLPCKPLVHCCYGLDDLPSEAEWYDSICRGDLVKSDCNSLMGFIRQLYEQSQIESILMVPIFINETLWGYIGLDDCHQPRSWSHHEESILTLVAKSIGGAIQRQQTEAQIRYQAFHDLLTGLPNRVMFNQHLASEVALAKQNNDQLAVLFLDLDHFKAINDTLGHTIGDLLLQKAARRLQGALRTQDLIARWGGDEFTLILPNLKTAEDARKIAQRLYEVLQPIFYINGHELQVQGSIGIALFPADGEAPLELLNKADAAMYAAKGNGRNTCAFYASTLNMTEPQCSVFEQSLRQAVNNQEFVLHYQPQINLTTGEVHRIEALIRWQHPDLGLVSPQSFMETAETTGLIVPIGLWVLREACAQNKAWQDQGLLPLRIAINLSARQLQEPNLVEQISQVLQETGLAAEYVELEITETAAMRDLDQATNVLQALSDMGCYISLDDFGTGYSSLSYLQKFPLDGLKIDRTFIKDLTHDEKDTAMLSAIITLGQGLGLNIVAEGVENLEQVNLLRSQRCDQLQGNWFSYPLPAPEMTEFLANKRYQSALSLIDWQLPLLSPS